MKLSEVEERTEEVEDSLLNDLLGDVEESPAAGNPGFDVTSLFNNEEEAKEFFTRLPMHILNVWANNDKVLHIVCPAGTAGVIKSMVDTSEIPGLEPDFVPIFAQLKDSIQYTEAEGETGIRLITLKQAINSREIISLHEWAHSVKLYDQIRARNLVIQPTMEELRMLALLDILLESKNDSKKIVAASRIPASIR